MDKKRVSMSYLVRVWQEDPSTPWHFWVKTLANNKEHVFSTIESFQEFFEQELFSQNQDPKTIFKNKRQ